MHFRPKRRTQLLVLLFMASSLAIDRRIVTNDFSDYPIGSQQCLYDASDNSGCDGDTVPEMNKCLCGNGGDFVVNSAKCVAKNDSDDMESTYETMSLHCSNSNTPLSVSKEEWMAEGSSVSSSTSSTSSTKTDSKTTSQTASRSNIPTTSVGKTIVTTTTSLPSNTYTPDASNNSGLSTGARVGIIVGSATVGLALFASVLLFLCRYRRHRNHTYEEVYLVGGQLPSNPESEIFGPTQPSIASTVPSDLENSSDPRKHWHPSPDGNQVPWSPSAFEAVKLHPGFGKRYQPPPDVYEMPTSSERSVSVSLSVTPVEMPIISVTSPTASPASRYSRADWSLQMDEEPGRYEPYRPSP
ncbi:hypothetical protein VM1G_09412 [Cytospora mali]|uniref:Extracellular membrane protein CFEM domain-containing protein n=1 Tax=Cytospora mali TaxID=578113 RepID=A0A194WBA4_CYTMA|nr:hypothetical protein VM1G_09412 [Valsa mali]